MPITPHKKKKRGAVSATNPIKQPHTKILLRGSEVMEVGWAAALAHAPEKLCSTHDKT